LFGLFAFTCLSVDHLSVNLKAIECSTGTQILRVINHEQPCSFGDKVPVHASFGGGCDCVVVWWWGLIHCGTKITNGVMFINVHVLPEEQTHLTIDSQVHLAFLCV
jgi:cbb3-type cytochrome oxidase subunit 1